VKLARRAENHRCWSVAAHCKNDSDSLLNVESVWCNQLAEMVNQSAWLAVSVQAGEIELLGRNVEKGLPCGSDDSVEKLGKLAGRALEFRPQGRPRLSEEEY
jgi:hypothetical protein